MDDALQKLARAMAGVFDRIIRTEIVHSEQEQIAVSERMAADGWHLAAASNAGLDGGRIRLTFLPASAFKKEPSE